MNQLWYIWKRTGEVRPPMRDEMFLGSKGNIRRAYFNFTEQAFPILTVEEATIDSIAHEGDPCIHCGKEHDEVKIGPCLGRCVAATQITATEKQ